MNNLAFNNPIESRIAELIKQTRINNKISQVQLAEGICSQSMISSIERGDYIPNAAMFISLCDRLGISLDEAFLKTKLTLGKGQKFSDHVFNLCKKHQYSAMLEYMDSPDIFSLLETNTDFQTYYYYYGCGFFQVTHNELTTRHYLKMALSYTMPKEYVQPRTEVETLLLNALGFINHLMNDDQEAAK